MKCIPVFLFAAAALSAQTYFSGQAARLVIGQPNGFTAQDPNSSNVTIGAPSGIATAGNTLFVADSNRVGVTPSNNRVLIFNNLSSQLPAPTAQLFYNTKCPACVGQANVVLGQPDFVTTTVNTIPTQNSLRNPQGVASDGVHLVVADTDDNRVLIWNQIPTTNNQNADVVIGQPNFTTAALPGNTPSANSMRGPEGVWIQNGKLFVADTQNNRILIYNHIPTTNGVAADVVLGAPNFTTYVNPDISQQQNGATASTMLAPVSVTSDGTRLFVTDLGFNRVLIFNSIPTTNGAAADVALGQPDLVSSVSNNAYTGSAATSTSDTTDKETPVLCKVSNGIDLDNNPVYPNGCGSTLNFPRFALNAGGKLVVADGGNDRLLVWDKTPPTTGSAPDSVIGQIADDVDDSSEFADGLRTPLALAWDGLNLYVSDSFNRRVLVYTIGSNAIDFDGIRNAASLNITATGNYEFTGTIQAGDVITLVINSYQYIYTVLSTDTLETITAAMVNAIQSANSGTGDPNVVATIDPIVDTVIDLTAKKPGDLANNVSYFANVTPAANQASAKVSVQALQSTLVGGGNAAKIAPGTVVSIFGTNLSATTAKADTTQLTLPTQLGGTQVYFNGIAAPLFMVSPTQINAQMPWELGDQTSVSAFVRSVMADGSVMYTTAVGVPIVPANPGVYTQTGSAIPPVGMIFHGSSYATSIISIDGGVTAGAVITITVNGRSYSHTTSIMDSLDSIRNAMVVQLNRDPQLSASIAGVFDRIILKARVEGPQGNGIPITGNASGGSLTVSVFDPVTCCSNIAGAPVTGTNPAVPGEIIVMYATGLGLPNLTDNVSGLVNTGMQYPVNGPVTVPQNFVAATIGGSTGDVLQATMLPGAVGQYQVVIHLNQNLVSSATTLATIAQNDFISNQVSLPLVAPSGQSGLNPALVVGSVHSGNFYQGQQNASYILTVTNNGGGNPTSGVVTVTDTLPTGMTLVQMIGDGWTCKSNSCSRSDILLATLSYPPITAIVNVAATAATPESNTVRVTGGGSASTVATDVTVINGTAPSNPPVLSVAVTHSGNFTVNQQNATYTITVSNKSGVSSTNGAVYVSELVPAGLTITAMSGTGWVCSSDSCSRSDALSGGSSYPVITVIMTVGSSAPASVTNMVIVSGGGSGAQIASNATTIQQ
ncbi:MAG TPA: hypothetical protein VHW09_31485 [Bryobacteraceae bacterium]|jgi:uncharacterized protein (TIGR03437 family)|nr:hypothetical protein [Bryobacteraceae bacterium]